MQNSTHLLIPKLSFQLLVKDILKEMEAKEEERGTSSYKGELHTNLPEDPDLGRNRFAVRMETNALLALHEAAEMYLVGILEEKQDGNLCAVHNKRVTLMPRDMSLVGRLRRVKIQAEIEFLPVWLASTALPVTRSLHVSVDFATPAMGNVVTQSCCHAHAKLHPVDKIVNLLLGCFLPLEKAVAGSTEDVRLKLLSDCRKAHEKMSKSYEKNVKGTWKVEERELPRRHGQGGPIQVAVHEPLERGARQDLPLIVWAHGGCMTLGDRHDSWGSQFFKALTAKIGPFCWASVEYRLAPESKFPACIDDFTSAYVSLADADLSQEFGYDVNRMSIMGVSAGALVAAHAALRLDTGYKPPLAFLYPMVDPEMRSRSHALFGGLPACPSRYLRLSWDWLLAEEGQVTARRLEEANLLTASWMPLSRRKVLVLLGIYDCLHDEGQALAQRCAQGGLRVTTVQSEGSHAVGHMVDKKAQTQLFEELAVLLK
ncbi:unnamed protein product [Symbiodinium sp. KB8]|nr:unnamed protein product [Symbiodinium sp. KB8]